MLRVEKEMVAVFLMFQLLRKATKNVILVFYLLSAVTQTPVRITR